MNLERKTALVTGASVDRRAIALELAKKGRTYCSIIMDPLTEPGSESGN